MGILTGKKILITGLLSDRSVAYGVAKACVKHGAEIAITYMSERFLDRATNFAKEFNTNLVFPCDVTKDEDISNLFKMLKNNWDGIDGLLHSIAYTPKNGISGDFVDNLTRDIFNQSNDISAYSFASLAKHGRSMMKNRNSSMVCLSYLGGTRVVPNYNMAGVSKAALEAITKIYVLLFRS